MTALKIEKSYPRVDFRGIAYQLRTNTGPNEAVSFGNQNVGELGVENPCVGGSIPPGATSELPY